ncbi:MAG: dihydroorotate dehydrogenase electron transfer subunit [Candidatus Margulisiibacteriota bacterium]
MTVKSNTKVAHETYCLTLQAPQIAQTAQPGQFVNLSLNRGNGANLLRRPFSIHRVSADSIDLLYKLKGEVTGAMVQQAKGDHLGLIGPLGKSFTIPTGRRILLVGGGVGIAPLIFADDRLRAQNKTAVLYGVRAREDAVSLRGKHIHLHVDEEEKSFVCDNLEEKILAWEIEEIKTCGPLPMMREVVAVACRLGLEVEVSLEAHMACGFGVCLGCSIETKQGYQNVCSDGPVFNGKLIW